MHTQQAALNSIKSTQISSRNVIFCDIYIIITIIDIIDFLQDSHQKIMDEGVTTVLWRGVLAEVTPPTLTLTRAFPARLTHLRKIKTLVAPAYTVGLSSAR